ncbi:MAG: hypothetical protein HY055_09315 [Magnetospirillum sp.]|nr:hypothetical protein [Magnetospirillum sp.]
MSALAAQLDAEAKGRPVDTDWTRAQVQRLMAVYPEMTNTLGAIAARLATKAA